MWKFKLKIKCTQVWKLLSLIKLAIPRKRSSCQVSDQDRRQLYPLPATIPVAVNMGTHYDHVDQYLRIIPYYLLPTILTPTY